MPSFDVVSEFDAHEVNNAVDQANREVGTRFDFKGSGAEFSLEADTIKMRAGTDFQLKQMIDILTKKLAKRGVDVAHMDLQQPNIQHKKAEQAIKMKQGIDKDVAKKIIKIIKNEKIKVQASIQGEQVRVSGKKRDDLQTVIALLRDQDFGLPLQFENFRD